MKTTITIIGLLALGYILITVGYDRSMEVYCQKLDNQSKEYQNFHLSQLDHDECKNVYGIDINGEIK